eukprot:g114.t1
MTHNGQGQDRNLGSFPSKLHTDLRHVVEMLRRGKRPRFAGERLSLLEEALSSSSYRSMEELRHQIEAWREAERAAFDADRYYDSQRTLGYTEHNRGIQETLTRRTLQLCSLQTDSVPNKDWNLKLPSAMSFLEREASASVYQMQCSIVEGSTPNAHVVAQAENILAVDLGCGSGLSTVVASNLGLATIGLDLSSEMLRSSEWGEVSSTRGPLADSPPMHAASLPDEGFQCR